MSESDPRLVNRILIGLIVGAVAGTVTLLLRGEFSALLTSARNISTAVLDPFGQVFLRMLFFVVIPLVFASLVDMFMPRNHFGAFVGSNRNQLGEVLPLIAFGIPPEGIGIVLGVDRILDMTRTMVNVGSDMVTTTVVDAAARRSEQRSATRPSSA